MNLNGCSGCMTIHVHEEYECIIQWIPLITRAPEGTVQVHLA